MRLFPLDRCHCFSVSRMQRRWGAAMSNMRLLGCALGATDGLEYEGVKRGKRDELTWVGGEGCGGGIGGDLHDDTPGTLLGWGLRSWQDRFLDLVKSTVKYVLYEIQINSSSKQTL